MHTPAKILTLIAVFSTLLSTPANLNGQNGGCSSPIFEFDFSGAGQNCTFTCGQIINEAIWKVANDTCINTTDTIWLTQAECSAPGTMTEVNVQIDREGNQVDNDDFIIVDIYCSGSLISTDTTWGLWEPEGGNSNVRTNTYQVACAYPDFMIIEVIIGTNAANAKLKQMTSGSCTNCFVSPNLLPIYISNEKLTDKNEEVALSFDLLIDNPQFRELKKSNLSLLRSTDGNEFEEADDFTFSENDGRVTLTDKAPSFNKPYYKALVTFMDEEPKSTRVLKRIKSVESTKIYPNPNTGNRINIAYSEKIESVVISDATGKEVERIVPSDKKTSLQIETQNSLSTGMYYVTVNSQLSTTTFPMMVK